MTHGKHSESGHEAPCVPPPLHLILGHLFSYMLGLLCLVLSDSHLLNSFLDCVITMDEHVL